MIINYQNYDLFGGTIKINLPNFLLDVSQIRQVPDSQEVFILKSTHQFNHINTELSIIIEVLQKISNSNDLMTSIRLHFDSLAHDNSAQSSTVLNTSGPAVSEILPEPSQTAIRPTPQPILLEGIQTVSKFNRPASEADEVHIWMALWTLDGVGNGGLGTDLVLTINLPQADSNSSQTVAIQQTTEIFQQAATSLKIIDWNLFA
ncbi:hypothetical protein CROQUDRAFT_90105 [Cronartium quercuum f. sp. fusiforme G11]|uniref:Uncharacterized protein n=1 Tax=Cronartium quercuum f. sp. fusiforme G11 TaxID=708437 RepID=A0A9P6NS75_9BASI|nr:hypothetical protein CROQUDRAFT_90105 [Cronartium quercuum f. sp. fusiforme G11]